MLDMKNTPDVNGTSLLDNTLVVFFNECSNGADHALDDMPVLMFGAKALGLRRGSNLRFGGKRYMTDVWASVAGAFGAPIVRFGDPAWGSGALSGLFG